MDDLLLIMTVGNSIQDRPDQNGGIVFGEMSLLALSFGNDAIKQLTAGAKLGDEVKVLGIFVNVHQRDNVGMTDLTEDLHLALEDFNFANLGLAD